MATEKKVNYTDAQVARMREMDAGGNGAALEAIATELNKPVRSIRAKLVHEKVYVAVGTQPKTKAEEGPTKKEMLARLASLGAFSVDGLENATKDAIAALTAFVEDALAGEEEAEEVPAEEGAEG